LVKGVPVEDRLVLAVEPFASVVNSAEVDAVLEKIGEWTASEGNILRPLR
jgi:hypothetical protein